MIIKEDAIRALCEACLRGIEVEKAPCRGQCDDKDALMAVPEMEYYIHYNDLFLQRVKDILADAEWYKNLCMCKGIETITELEHHGFELASEVAEEMAWLLAQMEA